MENAFEKYDWSSIKLLDVCGVKASKGHKSKSFGDTGFYQIGIKFTGSTEIFYNGERIMYDDGCVIYLPKEKRADVPYNKTILENGTGVCIFFDSEKELPHKPMRFKFDGDGINSLFVKINDLYNSRTSSVQFGAISVFYEILDRLCKKQENERMTGKRYSALEPAVEYISAHFTDEYVSIDLLADKCMMAKDYFRHLFKETYGVPPLKYINALKMNYIKKTLCTSRYSLTEIAEMAGFSELNYFSRFFKKQLGISPSEYRKRYCGVF